VVVATEETHPPSRSRPGWPAILWFLTALVGQWMFVYFIVVFYGFSTVQGHFSDWGKNGFLFKGYVPGDTAGNLSFGAHALLAAVTSGALQLVPQIRTYAISFHRLNGRLFLLASFLVSITGLYMVWVRGSSGNLTHSQAVSTNAVLIILFGCIAWRQAVAGKIASHRRWTLRTFVVANGQWFFRIGVFAWIIINQGPAWIGEHFDGPFIVVWDVGCYLLPLTVLEFYLHLKDTTSTRGRTALASVMLVFTALSAVGLFGVFTFLWQPLLAKL